MFWALNRVIYGLFSTFIAPVVPEPKKLSQLNRNIFRPYSRETIRIAPQTVSVCFGCKIESSEPDFQLFQLLWYSGLQKSPKFGRNIFQLYWLKTIWISPQIMRVCFGCKLSHPGPVFHFTYSSGARARKSRHNSTKTVFSNADDRW